MKPAQKKAQTIARQMLDEPLEILKSAKAQVAGENITDGISERAPSVVESSSPVGNQQSELLAKVKNSRRMEAFQRELSDIQKEELFKDLQRRIAQGEEVPLQDYRELSLEQKQVLKAQMEAVKVQKNKMMNQEPGMVEPTAKKSRRLFNFGKKQEVKRQQTRVENVVPPSG
jgi:hypothetical protein